MQASIDIRGSSSEQRSRHWQQREGVLAVVTERQMADVGVVRVDQLALLVPVRAQHLRVILRARDTVCGVNKYRRVLVCSGGSGGGSSGRASCRMVRVSG